MSLLSEVVSTTVSCNYLTAEQATVSNITASTATLNNLDISTVSCDNVVATDATFNDCAAMSVTTSLIKLQNTGVSTFSTIEANGNQCKITATKVEMRGLNATIGITVNNPNIQLLGANNNYLQLTFNATTNSADFNAVPITFNASPLCSITPTNTFQLCNKAYVDTEISNLLFTLNTRALQNWSSTSKFNGNFKSIVYGNGRFVMIGATGSPVWKVQYSNPPFTLWGLAVGTSPLVDLNWQDICFADFLNFFVVVCYARNLPTVDTELVLTSTDGVSWIQRNNNKQARFTSICWSKEQVLLVIVGKDESGNGVIQTSSSAIFWTAPIQFNVGTPGADACYKVKWIKNLGIFLSMGGTQSLVSTDGVTWTYYPLPSAVENFAYSPQLGKIIGVRSSTIITSTNGTTWTTSSCPTYSGGIWTSIAWAPEIGLFVVLPESPVFSQSVYTNIEVMTSKDGVNWKKYIIKNYGGSIQNVVWSSEYQCFIAVAQTPYDSPAIISQFFN